VHHGFSFVWCFFYYLIFFIDILVSSQTQSILYCQISEQFKLIHIGLIRYQLVTIKLLIEVILCESLFIYYLQYTLDSLIDVKLFEELVVAYLFLLIIFV
jgi:hypothetical protein